MRLQVTLLALLAATAFGGRIPAMVPGVHYMDLPEFHTQQELFVFVPTGIKCTDILNGTEFIPLTFTNGSCHDVMNPEEGLSNQPHIRTEKPAFVDGIGAPLGFDRPSAREISNAVIQQPDGLPINIKNAARILIFFGQFMDHDFALVLEQEPPPLINGIVDREAEEELELEGEVPAELIPIEIPADDPVFRIPELIITRSVFVTDEKGVRQFNSVLTPYLDLNPVYGDVQNLTDTLREKFGGLLRVDPDILSLTGAEFPPLMNPLFLGPLCGDIRCGENTQLFAWHTLWLRNHNYWARELTAAGACNGNFSDPILFNDLIFENARVRNMIEYQYIVWEQYLPYLLGRQTFFDLTGPYTFSTGVDPTTSLIFTTAIFRYGHSGVSNDLAFLGNDGEPIRDPLQLADSFMMPRLTFEAPGQDPTDLVGAMFMGQGAIGHDVLDSRVVSGIRDSLFANVPMFAPGFDLPARNIARARDHGVSTINNYRMVAGLEPYECPNDPMDCFNQITTNTEIAQALFELYEDIEECEVWPCGMAEDSFLDSLLGETFTFVMAESFNRLRQSDRLWYDNQIVKFRFVAPYQTNCAPVEFPVGLSEIVERNTNAEVGEAQNLFMVDPVWVAYTQDDEFQVEWFLPRNIPADDVEAYRIIVDPPVNGISEFEQSSENLLSRRVREGAQSGTTYTVSVMAEMGNGAEEEIGEVTFTQGGGNALALNAGAIAGIVIGGVVALAGVVGLVVFVRRRSAASAFNQETFL